MPGRPVRLVLALALAVSLAACKRGAEEREQGATGGAAASAAPGRAAAGAREHVQAERTGGGWRSVMSAAGAAGGAAGTAPISDERAAVMARRAAALAAARAMTIQAATGGVYRSTDGRVEVTVPPGALVGDAVVRFWPVETSKLPGSPLGAPGLVIDGDWGGAKFNPGAKVTFKAPVDERFVQTVRRVGGDPAQLGVSRDSQGRSYLEVTMTVDEAGRPESVARTRVGSGSIVEAAQIPVRWDVSELVNKFYKKAEEFDPDPLPQVPAGVPTMEPLPVKDPLVARYPAATADDFHSPKFAEVRALERGEQRIEIRDSLTETMAGDPAMVTCVASECEASPIEPIIEAVRLNASVRSRRTPPDGLRKRTANPDLGCPTK